MQGIAWMTILTHCKSRQNYLGSVTSDWVSIIQIQLRPSPFYFTRWLLKTIFFCIVTNSTNMIFTSSYPPLAEIPQCNVIDFLFQNPNKIPDDHPMLVDAVTNDCLTYGDLRLRILEFAAGLQDQCNFKKGDSLLLCSPNHVSIISIQSLCIVINILSPLVDISMSIQFHWWEQLQQVCWL